MRPLLAFLALALAAPAAGAAPRGVRLAVVHDHPLLRSETRALAAAQKAVGKATKEPVTIADATPAEAAMLSAAGTAPPDEWSAVETVVVLQLLPPKDKVARGAGSLLVFRPPQLEPVYAERVQGSVPVILAGEDLGKWLSDALALVTP